MSEKDRGYFFFGPLLTIAGFGVDDFVLFPPFLDMAHASFQIRPLRQDVLCELMVRASMTQFASQRKVCRRESRRFCDGKAYNRREVGPHD